VLNSFKARFSSHLGKEESFVEVERIKTFGFASIPWIKWNRVWQDKMKGEVRVKNPSTFKFVIVSKMEMVGFD
jgi:hypothetical protein